MTLGTKPPRWPLIRWNRLNRELRWLRLYVVFDRDDAGSFSVYQPAGIEGPDGWMMYDSRFLEWVADFTLNTHERALEVIEEEVAKRGEQKRR